MTEVLMHQEGTEIMSTHAPHNSAPRIHDAKPGRPAKGIVINSGKQRLQYCPCNNGQNAQTEDPQGYRKTEHYRLTRPN